MKKQFFVLACSFFFCLGGNILNFSLIYRLADRFLFTPGQIGTFIALGQLFYFAGCNLYHRFGSVFSPGKVFPAAAAVVFLASIPLSHADTRHVIYVSYWILQIGTGFFWPPVMAWLTGGLNDEELNREIGLFNRSWMGANIAGPLLAGALYHWNSNANFFFLNASYFMVLVLLFAMGRFFRKFIWQEEESSPAIAAGVPDPVEKIYPSGANREGSRLLKTLDKKLDLYRYRGWIGNFCSALFIGVLVNIVPLHIRDGLGYTERTAGMLLFSRSAMGFIGFTILARFRFWHFNRKWFFITQAGLIFCSFLLLIAGKEIFILFLVGILYGFINSACYNNSIFYAGATGRNPKKNLAFHEIVMSVGNASGTAGGGLLYQHFRFTGTCLAMLLVLGTGLGVLFYIDKRNGSKAKAVNAFAKITAKFK